MTGATERQSRRVQHPRRLEKSPVDFDARAGADELLKTRYASYFIVATSTWENVMLKLCLNASLG